jgi:hypothetical protein
VPCVSSRVNRIGEVFFETYACIWYLLFSPLRQLGILLRTLCDRTNRIGEIGYFLASFEAAVTHVQEIDLTEDRVELLSFSSAPLTEISLGD